MRSCAHVRRRRPEDDLSRQTGEVSEMHPIFTSPLEGEIASFLPKAERGG